MISKAELIDNIADRYSEIEKLRRLIIGLNDSIQRLEKQYQNENQSVLQSARRCRDYLNKRVEIESSKVARLQSKI
tara:strand:- start:405 stop:632 length:228 start_codon:yes stop_codon:yes gene_type:complete